MIRGWQAASPMESNKYLYLALVFLFVPYGSKTVDAEGETSTNDKGQWRTALGL